MTTVDPLSDTALAHSLDGGFTSRHADVDGVRLHYVSGGDGDGDPLILLGGWPQTWWQWNKVMPALARRRRVIAVDLRGMGSSSKPEGGYDKRTMARDVHALAEHLGLARVDIAGHDIGAMVAYAHAALFPGATGRICLLDVPHPDGDWSSFTLLPGPHQYVEPDRASVSGSYLWWFALNQVQGLPEALLEGRYRLLSDWLFDHSAKDPASIDERSRQVYGRAYSTADAIRSGNAWYRAFNTDIEHERDYGKVEAPLLALGGDESNYAYLRDVMPSKGADVRVAEIADCGHYLPEEQPEAVVDALESFLR
ncbi:alpha/beta hydrolase [Nocardiopsis tropica]|uniref:Alpha/beta hydrolase n=1 Tax=Nocardiopsis tropica TaxID=109330 RepID=A0ABU7KKW5_9ACTN|nr:alpha/beta hydrolase [Nocardiopsis umidischolae]MEE2049332.1 alpha/beta hydrolase [Nocardiopsis umidischolae]